MLQADESVLMRKTSTGEGLTVEEKGEVARLMGAPVTRLEPAEETRLKSEILGFFVYFPIDFRTLGERWRSPLSDLMLRMRYGVYRWNLYLIKKGRFHEADANVGFLFRYWFTWCSNHRNVSSSLLSWPFPLPERPSLTRSSRCTRRARTWYTRSVAFFSFTFPFLDIVEIRVP